MSEAATVCANLRERSILRDTNNPEESIVADLILIQEALAVDLKLQSWGHSLDPDWAHISTHPLTNENRPSWVRELLASPGAPSLDVLITLTDEIACSVPYALTISPDEKDLVRGRDFAQRAQWFRTILRFLRDTMGIAKVDIFLKEQRETF
ncbi:hypothetical protein PoHVEF18_004589 [Penicillium ochrochloron]